MSQSGKPRHLPQRTCLGCRATVDKGRLIRLVRTATGEVHIDKLGRRPGRGTYLCGFRDCWEKGLKGNRLEYALRGKVDAQSRKQLLEYGQSLPVRL